MDERESGWTEKTAICGHSKTGSCRDENSTTRSAFPPDLPITGVPETDGENTDQIVLDVAKSAGMTL